MDQLWEWIQKWEVSIPLMVLGFLTKVYWRPIKLVATEYFSLFFEWKPNYPVLRAIVDLAFGPESNHNPHTNNPPTEIYNRALDKFRVKAQNKTIPVWGKVNGSLGFEKIPPHYWENHQLDWMSFTDGDIERFKTKPINPNSSAKVYFHLMTHKWAVRAICLEEGTLV